MSFTPISNTAPQYEENGIAASGFYIKLYESGTTTPTAMATDSTGATLLDKCQLNSEGYPINGSGAVFIPHINVEYKIALFRNEDDANNNNLANAAWDIDGLFPVSTGSSIGTGFDQIPLNTNIVYPVATVADLRLLTGISVGQKFQLDGHTNQGLGGGPLTATKLHTTEIDNDGSLFVVDGVVIKRSGVSYSTPADFGCLGDGTDETTKIQAWLDDSTSLIAGTNPGDSFTEYLYSNLVMSKENHKLTVIGDVRFRTTNSSSTSSFIVSGNYGTIENGFFIGTDNTGAVIETTGFSNYLNQVQVSGTSRNALRINGLETKVFLGRYRGGSDAVMLVEQPDAYLLGPYVEQGTDGLKSVGIGSINAYHVHSFGNLLRGFNLSGASFSQLTSCYADTSGSNGFEARDTAAGITMTDCWSFKSGELVANSAQMQFFNCQNTKLIGCRMNTPGAAGTSESIRFSGTTNQIDLVSCYADQATESFQAPNVMTACTGKLQEYSRAYSTYLRGAQTVPASGTKDIVITLNTSTEVISPGFKSYDIRITYRASSGGAAVGVEDWTVFILNGISGPGTSVCRFPTTPVLDLSNPVLVDIGNESATLTVTLTNADATRNFQCSASVVERDTPRGYI